MNLCDQTHERCNVLDQPSRYPKRLLDVQAETDENIVKLIYVEEHGVCGKYLSLSHCWGDGDFLQLKGDTEAALLSGINIDQVPQTFQDAICICRAMKVRYIWIDSLCIRQDDTADWLEESEAMGEIYSSAHCNISADACDSSTESMFRERDLKILQRNIVEILSPSVLAKPGKYLLLPAQYHEQILKEAPANTRAWVLQERLLARRVLHFTKNEIMWECRSLTASELFPKGLTAAQSGWGWFKDLGPGIALNSVALDERQGLKFHLRLCWARVAMLYSSTLLTFSEDRLVAISAAAKLFQKLLDDEYILGMWKRTLLIDLLWRCPSSKTFHGKEHGRRRFRLPSFSWLSVDCDILTGPGLFGTELAEVISVEIQHVTKDTTGLVHGGQLHLKGRLRHIKLPTPPKTGIVWVTLHGHSVPLSLFPDFAIDESCSTCQDWTIFILPLLKTIYAETIEGIVLEPVIPGSSIFRRVGCFRTTAERQEFNDGDLILERQEGEELYPCELYDADDSRHTICIE